MNRQPQAILKKYSQTVVYSQTLPNVNKQEIEYWSSTIATGLLAIIIFTGILYQLNPGRLHSSATSAFPASVMNCFLLFSAELTDPLSVATSAESEESEIEKQDWFILVANLNISKEFVWSFLQLSGIQVNRLHD